MENIIITNSNGGVVDINNINNNITDLNISITPFLTSPSSSSPSVQPQKKKTIEDFIIGKVLGEGSYGAVVLGTEKETNTQYAIKILEKKQIIKENKIKYVQIEKEIFCKSNHPNIVKLFFTFRSEACLYYVLELCSQGDLLHQIKKVGSFDYKSCQYYVAEIISGVEHLHGLGIVHRDLKPENILMSVDLHLKITDFGTGKILPSSSILPTLPSNSSGNLGNMLGISTNGLTSSIDLSAAQQNRTNSVDSNGTTDSMISPNLPSVQQQQQDTPKPVQRTNSFVGTAEYVSPELISNKETSTDSDLWALGCIIYQMTTGRVPFRGKTEFLTFQKVSNRELVYPTNIDPVIKDLIEKLLVIKPTDRLGSSSTAGGFDNLKSHPFFAGFDWSNLSTMTPPPIQPPTEKIVFDEELFSPSLDSCITPRNNNNRTASSPNTSNNNLSTIDEQPQTSLSSSNSSISTTTPQPPMLLPSSLSSVSREQTRGGTYVNDVSRWLGLLNSGENIIHNGLVWKRKGFSIKKRQLILTDTPRLIYVDPKKMEIKGEIPWSDTIVPKLKSNNNFVIQTPKRKYLLEDVDHNPQKWVDSIKSVILSSNK